MSPPNPIRLTCACGLVTGAVTPHGADTQPLPLTLCHCTTCRHQSGLLSNTYATIPPDAGLDVHGPLKAYKSSPAVSRYFCGKCGANVYLVDASTGDREICTGVLEGAEGVGQVRSQIFVSDTKDGGMSDWILGVEAWKGFSKESEKLEGDWKDESKTGAEREKELQAYCHCKGVSFKIMPPDESSAHITAPRGDIVGPSTTEQGNAKDDRAWWLRENGTKYLGGTCACNECRRTSGFDIQTWAFVPKAKISQPNGKPLDFNAGTLKRYNSSEGVYRDFCSTCGATVFWHSDSRPELIDVSVGLLNAEAGARAETWLGWKTERVSFEEEAQNKDLISKLSAGLKQWGETRVPSSVGA